MKRITILTLIILANLAYAQRSGGRSWNQQRQMDPEKVPKIGVVYGTVVDSTSGTPIPLSLIHI